MGYLPIFLIWALLSGAVGGASAYFSWRFVENRYTTVRTLPMALGFGFLAMFLIGLALVLFGQVWQALALRWFGGNGFLFAVVMALIAMMVHYRLLLWGREHW